MGSTACFGALLHVEVCFDHQCLEGVCGFVLWRRTEIAMEALNCEILLTTDSVGDYLIGELASTVTKRLCCDLTIWVHELPMLGGLRIFIISGLCGEDQ